MQSKSNLYCAFCLIIVLASACSSRPIANPNPDRDGYISQPETAIKIAEAVWQPIYGDEIYRHKPFHAELKDSVWVVTGTVHSKLGGGPRMVINKNNGQILVVEHEL
jgi:hypothetical protein